MQPGRQSAEMERETCAYCDRSFDPAFYGSAKTRDHIIPRSMMVAKPFAGRGNDIPACGACNGIKANMMPSALRATADEHRKRAALLDQIAARVDELITARGLLPPFDAFRDDPVGRDAGLVEVRS